MRTSRFTMAAWAAVLLALVVGATASDAAGKRAKPGKAAAAGKDKDAPATRELAGSCTDSDATALWVAPLAPAVGQPVKVMGVGDGGDLTVTDPQGGERALTVVRRDGTPV
ncbi:MAG TPA: hypothetical protein VIF57_01140, partial [Polyangia bacterium]